MPEVHDRHVLTGVDGSVESLAALGLAAVEAALRHAQLVVTHAWAGPPWRPGRMTSAPTSRTDAERLLAAATAWLRLHHPELPVTGRLVLGDPVDVLTAGSATAQMVVVGHRGTGMAAIGWGSVAAQLSRRCRVPLIVRTFRPQAAEPPPDAPVVVAVSAEPSDHTLRFAFDQAARYGVPLVPCYVRPAAGRSRAGTEPAPEALAQWSVRHPEVAVRPRVRQGSDVARALVDAARDARLLVVGAGPDRAVVEVLRGSVSRSVLRGAPCPVAVVPEPVVEAVGNGAGVSPPAGMRTAGGT